MNHLDNRSCFPRCVEFIHEVFVSITFYCRPYSEHGEPKVRVRRQVLLIFPSDTVFKLPGYLKPEADTGGPQCCQMSRAHR
jgi:hypothetical protein